MTWRAFSYTLLVFLAIVAIATTASLGFAPEDATSTTSSATLAMESQPLSDPGTRIVLLLFGSLAILITFRQALRNLRTRTRS